LPFFLKNKLYVNILIDILIIVKFLINFIINRVSKLTDYQLSVNQLFSWLTLN
jgi:hypothetical protein